MSNNFLIYNTLTILPSQVRRGGQTFQSLTKVICCLSRCQLKIKFNLVKWYFPCIWTRRLALIFYLLFVSRCSSWMSLTVLQPRRKDLYSILFFCSSLTYDRIWLWSIIYTSSDNYYHCVAGSFLFGFCCGIRQAGSVVFRTSPTLPFHTLHNKVSQKNLFDSYQVLSYEAFDKVALKELEL